MQTSIVHVSKNCWKHVNENSVYYRETSDTESDLHREDGPAIEIANRKTHWFYKGTYIPFKTNLKLLKKK